MVTAGILRTPIAGPLFERCGAIRTRIAAALTRGLAPLRADEPAGWPAHVDPTRPTTATAAFPGGVAPRDIPA
jgi:hypothetical protein